MSENAIPFSLNQKSKDRLQGVHFDLVKVVQRAIEITTCDFEVLEGVRSLTRQQQLVKAGASQTMRSRHLTGHAVDLVAHVNGAVRWDWPLYGQIATAMKMAARELAVPLEWGGDWKKFKDGPHFQIPWKYYP